MGRDEPVHEVPVVCRHCGSARLRYMLSHFRCLDCNQTTSLHQGPTKRQRRNRRNGR